MAVEGVPCLNTPVPFDPSLGPGTPGFEDPTPTFQPSCPGDPPVGALRLADPRAEPSTLRWRHPSRWRSLRDVTVRVRRPARRARDAALRPEQNRLTLGRRSLDGRVAPAG